MNKSIDSSVSPFPKKSGQNDYTDLQLTNEIYNINKDKKSRALKLLSVHKLDFVLKVKCFSAAK